MTSGRDPAPTRRSFRIHGGECVLSPTDGTVRIDQSVRRHHHPLGWLLTGLAVVGAGYGLATGWRYPVGGDASIGWLAFALIAAYMLALPGWRYAREYLRGYSRTTTISIADLEDVRLTETRVRWYVKTRRTVPACELRYRTDGETRRRRFKLPLRSGRREIQAAVDAFEDLDIPVETERTVARTLDSFG